MKRGEIWTLQDDHYASKARPAVILQSELVDEFDSVIVSLFTSFKRESSPTRVQVEPSLSNGLTKISYVMVEKLFTVPRSDLGALIGCLTDEQLHAVSRSLVNVLAITAEDLTQAG
ncbi:MAG: type II toxin-antitoxin system PemK/MazF family toxin [Propionibacteriaceae bacterium]|jgi:mRNA interferase MazF|nr:type II toxin-antitoxin system PemK/MazF family toxin [Propionibacteriaceae bacterium]